MFHVKKSPLLINLCYVILNLLTVLFFLFCPVKSYSVNLLSQNPDAINLGAELYKKRCSNCHGKNAQGKDNGFFLSPNLRIFKKGYNEFLEILVNGYGRMPAWGGRSKLSKNQLDELASYLEHISTPEANWK